MRKQKLPSMVTVLALTLITVVMWVSFEVYRLFVKPVEPSVPERVMAPIEPTLNQGAMDQIRGGLFLNDSEIPDVVVGAFATSDEVQSSPTPQPTEDSGSEEGGTAPVESPGSEEETATSSGQST